MKKNISIEICTGTTCYVMGASDLLTIEDHISDSLSSRVIISGSTCLGMCKERKYKPPFVRVCGKLISHANIGKVLEAVKAEEEKVDYAYDE